MYSFVSIYLSSSQLCWSVLLFTKWPLECSRVRFHLETLYSRTMNPTMGLLEERKHKDKVSSKTKSENSSTRISQGLFLQIPLMEGISNWGHLLLAGEYRMRGGLFKQGRSVLLIDRQHQYFMCSTETETRAAWGVRSLCQCRRKLRQTERSPGERPMEIPDTSLWEGDVTSPIRGEESAPSDLQLSKLWKVHLKSVGDWSILSLRAIALNIDNS